MLTVYTGDSHPHKNRDWGPAHTTPYTHTALWSSLSARAKSSNYSGWWLLLEAGRRLHLVCGHLSPFMSLFLPLMGDMRVIHLPGHQTLTPSVTKPFQFLITCFSCCHLPHLSSQLWLGISSLQHWARVTSPPILMTSAPITRAVGQRTADFMCSSASAKQININKCYQEQSSPGALVPSVQPGTELGAQTRAWNIRRCSHIHQSSNSGPHSHLTCTTIMLRISISNPLYTLLS